MQDIVLFDHKVTTAGLQINGLAFQRHSLNWRKK